MGSGPDFTDVTSLAKKAGLDVLGIVALAPGDGLPPRFQSLVLLGPDSTHFWPALTNSPEGKDGQPDPVDRFSTRVVSAIAASLKGQPVFPFGHAPPLPFISWALRSNTCFISDVNLLVHERAGLWVSFRGAIALERNAAKQTQAPSPCVTCTDKPCLNACPVGALTEKTYDVPVCHQFLDTPDGTACLKTGCRVRQACPISQTYGRFEEQSAHHMRYFHK